MSGIVTTNYFKEVRKNFEFLEKKYDYKRLNPKYENMTFKTIYINKMNNRKIKMGYDIHDNDFYFYIIRGEKGVFPEPYTGKDEDILMFYDVFRNHTRIPFKNTLPDNKQYIKALELNAELLMKYGEKILRGEKWIRKSPKNRR